MSAVAGLLIPGFVFANVEEENTELIKEKAELLMIIEAAISIVSLLPGFILI